MTGHPVLEVGGTHVLGCRVDAATWRIQPGSAHRRPLDSGGSAEEIVTALARCARELRIAPAETLAVAIPGPFDYAAGIGRFRDVGKFEALAGFDVRRALRDRLAAVPGAAPPRRIAFVNDAAAFGLGEWLAGAAHGFQRAVAITLGTGTGSAFVAEGKIVSSGPSVPPGGEVHRLLIAGRPLEETVSRRAIIAAYRRLVQHDAGAGPDVRDIAALALRGDGQARRVFTEAFRPLGAALATWLTRFRAQVLVAGGSMTASWALISEPLRDGLGPAAAGLEIVTSPDSEASAAAGAAWHGQDRGG
jgi:glucokinase